ncbi:hypothetical protein [Dishui Lake phycodnavirus 4]|nr:hypothetical protein [Dishui Lake phycodnavirus 4]
MQRLFVEKDAPLYKHTLQLIHTAWGSIKTPHVFPGPQPISIERRHFDILKKNDYVVCEKTDGVRHMLLVFMYEHKKVSMFVNRALEMFETKIRFSKNTYDGTLFDGELYDDKYMIYDVVVANGKHIGHMNFLDRLDAMEAIIKSAMTMKSDDIKIKLKKFHALIDFDIFLNDYLPSVSQNIDGLVFTPVHEPIRIGTHETLFKWKEKDHNTIDFLVRFENNRWRLYVQDKGQLVFESILDVPPEWIKNDTIVECQYITENRLMYWKPLKQRTDKTHPNNRRTFYRTLFNIKEDIKIEEFLVCR